MNLRLAIYELAAQHQLDAKATSELQQIAGLRSEPARLVYWLPRGLAIFAAALCGLGIIFWIAANWGTLGRFGRFALLQLFFLSCCAGAWWKPSARIALSLLALLSIGALFAYFGQTYQTGADPWQLFAVWGVLALPLCLTIRSDVLWTPWVLVCITGISLWIHAHTSHSWRVEIQDSGIFAIGWCAAFVLVLTVSPLVQRLSGAGPWALRTAVTLMTIMITSTALGGLFQHEVAGLYWWGMIVLVVAAAALASKHVFEIYGLSAVGLGLNVLLVVGLGRVLFHNAHGDQWIGSMLLLGLVAAGLLATTVSVLLRLSRSQNGSQNSQGLSA